MPGKEEREELLSSPLFSDILNLINSYNEKIRDSKDTQFLEELQEIELAIQDSLIPSIRCTNPLSIEQGIALLGCQNKKIIELFIQQLFTEIKNNQSHFPELYSALAACINKEATAVLSGDDKLQLSTVLIERMDTIHALDIAFTCYRVHTLYAVLYKMIEEAAEHGYDKQKEKIKHTLLTLHSRTRAIKLRDIDEKVLLANIQEAIKFSYHILNKLEDTSLDTRRCLYKIKIAGLLLLQASEVNAQWHGAVASTGAGAPSALGTTYSFMSHLLRRGKQVYNRFHDNQSYFTALIKWRKSLEKYLVASEFEEAKTFLEKLKENIDLPQHWDNPHFILGAIKILLVTYELYPEVQATIIGLLIHYYESNKEKQDSLSQQIVKQVGFTILKLLEETSISTPLLKSQLEGIRDKMSEERKALYISYQQSKEISKRNSQYNLAMEAWKQRYEGDVKLYGIGLLVSKKGSEALTKEQLNYIGKLCSGVSSNQLSNWGKAVLATFSEQQKSETTIKKVKNVHYGDVYDNSLYVTSTSKHAEEIALATDKLAETQATREEKRKLSQLASANKGKDVIPSNSFNEVDNFHYGNKHYEGIYFTEIPQNASDIKKERVDSKSASSLSSSQPESNMQMIQHLLSKYDNLSNKIEKLDKRIEEKPSSKNKVPTWIGCIPSVVTHFIGREDRLKNLREGLDNEICLITSKQGNYLGQSVIGIGGVGKTQLAAKYVADYGNEYNIVIWLNADPGLIEIEFLSMASILGVTQGPIIKTLSSLQLQSVTNQVYEWFKDNIAKVLVIFDGAVNKAELKSYLPNNNGNIKLDNNQKHQIHFIITSQYQGWERQDTSEIVKYKVISLDLFSIDEAREFLRQTFQLNLDQLSDDTSLAFKNLTEVLGGLPLALRQAATFIVRTKNPMLSLADKIKDYILKFKESYIIGGEDEGQNTISNTCKLTLDHLTKNTIKSNQFKLVLYCGYFNSEISFGVLLKIFNINIQALEDLLYKLSDYSLLEVNYGNEFVKFHPMTQIAIQSYIEELPKASENSSNKRPFKPEKIINCLLKAYNDNVPEDELAMFFGEISTNDTKQYIPHILKIITHAMRLQQKGNSKILTDSLVSLISKVGTYRAWVPKSHYVELQEKLISISKNDLSMFEMAKLLMVEGFMHYWGDRYKIAEDKLSKSLDFLSPLQDDNKFDIEIRATALLAVVYQTSRQHRKSEEKFIEVMKILRAFCEKNPKAIDNRFILMLLGAYHGMSVALSRQEKYNEAITLSKYILKTWTVVKTNTQSASFLALVNRELATALVQIGKINKAEQYFSQAIHIQQQASSPEKDLATTYLELAYLCRYQRKFKEAKELTQQALKLYTENYDNHYFGIALARCDLARIMLEEAYYSQCYENFQDILDELTKAWKNNEVMRDEEKVYNLILLSIVNYCLKDFKEAKNYFCQAKSISFENIGFLARNINLLKKDLESIIENNTGISHDESKQHLNQEILSKLALQKERFIDSPNLKSDSNKDDKKFSNADLSELNKYFTEKLNFYLLLHKSLIGNQAADTSFKFSTQYNEKKKFLQKEGNEELGDEKLSEIPKNFVLACSPADGTCLFYSVTLASLLRFWNFEVNDNQQFLELDKTCRQLFSGSTNETELSVEEVKSIPGILRNHDGTIDFNLFVKGNDATTLRNLVEKNLRIKLCQYMKNNAARLAQKNEINLLSQLLTINENEIKKLADDIADANKWGELIHVLALSEMLKTCIVIHRGPNVDAIAMLKESIVIGSEYKAQNDVIHLLFTGNHYNFYIDPTHIPNIKDEAKESQEDAPSSNTIQDSSVIEHTERKYVESRQVTNIIVKLWPSREKIKYIFFYIIFPISVAFLLDKYGKIIIKYVINIFINSKYNNNVNTLINDPDHFYDSMPWNSGSMPINNKNFIGRESTLNELKNFSAIIEYNKDFGSQRAVGLIGPGGMGKTQIAAKYIYQLIKEEENEVLISNRKYKLKIWLKGDEKQLRSDLIWLANQLKIKITNDNSQYNENNSSFSLNQSIQEVYKHLKKLCNSDSSYFGPRVLFILDNGEWSKSISNLFPESKTEYQNCFEWIITSAESKDTSWIKYFGNNFNTISIDIFSDNESIKYLRENLKKIEDDNTLLNLANTLGHVPLALAQVVAYLNKNPDVSITKYIGQFNKKLAELSRVSIDSAETPYEKTILTTWLIALPKVNYQSSNAINLLLLCAYLADTNIPKSLLELEYKGKKGSLNLDLTLLKDYLFIDLTDENKLIQIRFLLQNVIRMWIKDEFEIDSTELNQIRERYNQTFIWQEITKIIIQRYKDISTLEQEKNLKIVSLVSLTPHYEAILNYFEDEMLLNLPITLELYNQLGNIYLDIGGIKEAQKYLEKAYLIYENMTDKNLQIGAALLGNLANVYANQEEYIKQITLLEKTLEIYQKLNQSIEACKARRDIVNSKRLIGAIDIESAIKELLDINNIQTEICQYNKYYCIETSYTLSDLGKAYGFLNDYEKKIYYINKSIEVLKKYKINSLNYELDLAVSLNNLGASYWKIRNISEAEPLFKEGLVLLNATYGSYSRLRGEILNNLANIAGDKGNYEEKVNLLKEVITIFGNNTQNAVIAHNNLANAYGKLNRTAEEVSEMELAFSVLENLELTGMIGANHYLKGVILGNLGKAYKNKEPLKAIDYLQKAVAIIPPKTLESARSYLNMAIAYLNTSYPNKLINSFCCSLIAEIYVQSDNNGKNSQDAKMIFERLLQNYANLINQMSSKTIGISELELETLLKFKVDYFSNSTKEKLDQNECFDLMADFTDGKKIEYAYYSELFKANYFSDNIHFPTDNSIKIFFEKDKPFDNRYEVLKGLKFYLKQNPNNSLIIEIDNVPLDNKFLVKLLRIAMYAKTLKEINLKNTQMYDEPQKKRLSGQKWENPSDNVIKELALLIKSSPLLKKVILNRFVALNEILQDCYIELFTAISNHSCITNLEVGSCGISGEAAIKFNQIMSKGETKINIYSENIDGLRPNSGINPNISEKRKKSPYRCSIDSTATKNMRVIAIPSMLSEGEIIKSIVKEDVILIRYEFNDTFEDFIELVESRISRNKLLSIVFALHGSQPGELKLFDNDLIQSQKGLNKAQTYFWHEIGNLLYDEGEIHLLGCNVAAGEEGDKLLEQLSEVSARKVLGSIDKTGNCNECNWILEKGDVSPKDISSLYFTSTGLEKINNNIELLSNLTEIRNEGNKISIFSNIVNDMLPVNRGSLMLSFFSEKTGLQVINRYLPEIEPARLIQAACNRESSEVTWYRDPNYEIDSKTGSPLFVVHAMRENIKVGYIKLFGQPDFCRSRSGLYHNIVELGGVLEGQEEAIDTRKTDNQCTSLPPSTFRSDIGQAAVYGGVLGSCNALPQIAAKRGLISQDTANCLSLISYYSMLYTLNFYKHYSQRWEISQENEEIAYSSAVEATIDTMQVAAVHAVSTGCRKLSHYLGSRNCNWSAGFFKVAERTINATRYIMPFTNALQEKSMSQGAWKLSENITQMGVGAAAQVITEKVIRRF